MSEKQTYCQQWGVPEIEGFQVTRFPVTLEVKVQREFIGAFCYDGMTTDQTKVEVQSLIAKRFPKGGAQ